VAGKHDITHLPGYMILPAARDGQLVEVRDLVVRDAAENVSEPCLRICAQKALPLGLGKASRAGKRTPPSPAAMAAPPPAEVSAVLLPHYSQSGPSGSIIEI
jgi:hypothetical protein